jgi:autotransporter-associated beta strand protein
MRCRRPFLCLLSATWLLACTSVVAAVAGLTGTYYGNRTFSGNAVSRLDAAIDFAWDGAPGPAGVGSEGFSVRWEGQVEALASAEHTFHVLARGGALLWVDDRLLVGRTLPSESVRELSGSLRLEAGRRYNLRLEFTDEPGAAVVRLLWSRPGTPRQVIPTTQLSSEPEPPERGSIQLEYWANRAGTDLGALTSAPGYPDKPSGRESLLRFECLAPDVGDNYGQRVIGYLVPSTSGDYTFAVAAADQAELWLSTDAAPANRVRLVRVQSATGIREYTHTSPPVSLQQGRKYYVELLHHARTGIDHFSVAWRRPGGSAFEVIGGDSLQPAGLGRPSPGEGNYLATLASGRPRLFITPQKVAWLKQQLAAGTDARLTGWYASLKSSADSLRNQPVNTYVQDNRGTILGVSRSILDRTYKWALAWLVTGDAAYAERLYQELERAANPAGTTNPGDFPDWHPPHFLDVAEMTHAFAIGLDWLYDYWTPARRDVLRRAIALRGLTPGKSEFDRNVGWTQPTNNNWNLVCTGGLTLGALAIAGESAADTTLVEQMLHRCVTRVAPVMERYTADNGAWYEGPGYWDFATDYNIRMLAALEGALGSDFSLSAIPGLALTGYFPHHLVGPTRLSFNFADAGSGNVAGSQLFWLARRFHAPFYAWYQRTYGNAEALGLLWHDSRGQDPITTGLPADAWFRGATGATRFAVQDIVTLRSRWMDARATFVAAKAGEVGASHGNLDAGSFVLDANGQRWAVELGADDYALPGYFSEPQRWTYYRMRAEGQNTLVINPGSGGGQVLRSQPPIVLFAPEPSAERGAVVMDLTSAYAGARRVQRGFLLSNRRRHVLIQDEIEYAAPAEVWWFMHFGSDKTAELGPDGTSATLSRGSDRLWLKILSGGGTFEVRDAAPLPTSPAPAGQNANATVRKLAIRLGGVTRTTLAVYAVPLVGGEAPPSSTPAVVPLADWPTTGNVPTYAWSAPTAGAAPQPLGSDSNWAGGTAPAQVQGANLDLFSGRILPAGAFTLENNLPASGTVSTLTLGGTAEGPTTVTLVGRALSLADSGALSPVINLDASLGAGLSYDLALPLNLGASVTLTGGGTAPFRFSGELSGPGGLTHASGATVLLTGTNTYSGPTVIATGTLQIGEDGSAGTLGRGPVVNHGRLRFDRIGTLTVPNDISGPGGIYVDCPIGGGTVVLSGGNTFTGEVNVRSGAIRITHGAALGSGPKTVFLNNGTAGNPQLRLDGSAGGFALPATLTLMTSNNTSGAVINEAGSNAIDGPIVLTSGGGNTKILVEAGLLTLNGTLAPNTTARSLDLGGAGDGAVNGTIADGSGANVLGFIKSGSGTWRLNGDNSWSGSTSINGGTLLVNGRLRGSGTVAVGNGALLGGFGEIAGPVRINSGGRLAPGAGMGTLTLGGSLTFAAGSTADMEINAATLASDRVAGSARISYGGTLAVSNVGGALALGQSFTLFPAGQGSGTFAAIAPATPGPGLAWDFDPAAGVLRVVGAPGTSDTRIANLSVLTAISPGEPGVIVGTVVGGGSASRQPLLVRVVGPSLAAFGVKGALADPSLVLHHLGPAVLATNDDWGGADALTAAFSRVGAFSLLSPASRDAALLREGEHALLPGAYTVHAGGPAGATGAILVELYDATPAAALTATSPRLINASVLKTIPSAGMLTAGLVLAGAAQKQVLLRAVGPTLGAAPFSLGDALPDPRLELFRAQTVIAANDNWGGSGELTVAFARTGAFALPADSRDAALLVTLSPGAYTAQITGVAGAAGRAIVEVYEVP